MQNRKFNICTNTYVGQKYGWVMEELSWEEICDRMSHTIRTKETFEFYQSLSKETEDKDEKKQNGDLKKRIKDQGGYVCGRIVPSDIPEDENQIRRLKENVINRCLITFDCDDMSVEDFEELKNKDLDFAYMWYTSHSHSKERPKVRILIPLAVDLTCDIMADQFEAVSRAVSNKYFNMEWLDTKTHEASRAMYYPSTSIDGEFEFFISNNKEFLNPLPFLDEYKDWTDSRNWYYGKNEEPKKKLKKSDGDVDPLNKPGWIGAFNRAHSIEEVLEVYLSDKYEKWSDGEYHFIGGTSGASAFIYKETRFTSFHASDPISGHARHAFDLVKDVLELEQDEMYELAKNDPKTRVEMLKAQDPQFFEKLKRKTVN